MMVHVSSFNEANSICVSLLPAGITYHVTFKATASDPWSCPQPWSSHGSSQAIITEQSEQTMLSPQLLFENSILLAASLKL